MLHTQQNYNTNYLNNNIGHSRPPIASEPPGKCFNLISIIELSSIQETSWN